MIKLGTDFRNEIIKPNSVHALITIPPISRNTKSHFKTKNKGDIQDIERRNRSTLGFSNYRQLDSIIWKKCFEVMVPGAYGFIFMDRRNIHRWACQIEDIGFELRDTIVWIYKNRTHKDKKNKSFLRASWEPILLIRKPLEFSTIDENWKKWKAGKLNMFEARIYNFDLEQPAKGKSKSPPNVVRTNLWRDDYDMHLHYTPIHADYKKISTKFHNSLYKYNKRPEKVIDFIIKVGSFAGQTILDPFAGYGSVYSKAIENRRKYIGFEIDERFKQVYDKYNIPYTCP